MDIARVQSHLKNYGLWPTLYHLGYRAVNHLLLFQNLRCLWNSSQSVNKKYSEAPPGFEARFLSRKEISNLPLNPESRVNWQFVETALEKGDECCAVFHGARLASFGWCSRKPTLYLPRLTVHFDPSCIYMYHGYTLPEYRGKHLRAVGTNLSVREYTNRGSKAAVTVVESNNLESLRSCDRMGYKVFGNLRVIGLFGELWTFQSRGCQAFSFFLEVEPQ